MSTGKDTGPAGESTPKLRTISGHRRTDLDVLELILGSLLRVHMDTQTEGTKIVHGPRDKGPGALRLEFDTGQVFYVDVQEEER